MWEKQWDLFKWALCEISVGKSCANCKNRSQINFVQTGTLSGLVSQASTGIKFYCYPPEITHTGLFHLHSKYTRRKSIPIIDYSSYLQYTRVKVYVQIDYSSTWLGANSYSIESILAYVLCRFLVTKNLKLTLFSLQFKTVSYLFDWYKFMHELDSQLHSMDQLSQLYRLTFLN